MNDHQRRMKAFTIILFAAVAVTLVISGCTSNPAASHLREHCSTDIYLPVQSTGHCNRTNYQHGQSRSTSRNRHFSTNY